MYTHVYLESFDQLPLLDRVMLGLFPQVVQVTLVLVQNYLGGLVQIVAHAWRCIYSQNLFEIQMHKGIWHADRLACLLNAMYPLSCRRCAHHVKLSTKE